MATMKRQSGGVKSFEKIDFALNELEGKRAQAGWFETAKYEDGTPVAYVATIHEFGSPQNSIPPRPFMRPTIQGQKRSWSELAKKGSKKVLTGSLSAGDVMELIAGSAVGDVKKTISQIQTPELKPATIRARQRKRADKVTIGNLSKPLVDTGTMLATMTHIVEDAK